MTPRELYASVVAGNRYRDKKTGQIYDIRNSYREDGCNGEVATKLRAFGTNRETGEEKEFSLEGFADLELFR